MLEFKRNRRKKGFCEGGPADISVLLKMVLDKNKISEDMTLKTLTDNFEKVVGPLLLAHISPVKFDKNILTLKCENSVWKHELFLQKKAIIEKCNIVLGKPAVRDVRLV